MLWIKLKTVLVLLGCMVIYLTLFKETSTLTSFDASTHYGIAKIDYIFRRQPISCNLFMFNYLINRSQS